MKRNNEQKTPMLKQADISHNWLILDASGKTLGRFAAEVAKILRGKHKPNYTPHADCGDGVIVINADKIRVTGSKEAQKVYRYYTGSMSGLREVPYRVMKARKPSYIIRHAVEGMMPSNRLTAPQMRRLRIVAGEDHGQAAQKPIQVNV